MEDVAAADRSNGYEAVATEFLRGRGNPRTAGRGIGCETVRTWALTLPRRATVLDVGCGAGVPITSVLVAEGLRVYAVDAAPSMVAAFKKNVPGVPVACEAVEDSAFFGRSFDAALAWGFLFLLPDHTQRHVLRRIASVLVPGGRLCFTAPAARVEWTDAMTGRPSRSLGGEAYRSVLREAGLGVRAEYDDEGENHYFDAVKRV